MNPKGWVEMLYHKFPMFGLLTISAKSSDKKTLFKELPKVIKIRISSSTKICQFFLNLNKSIQDYLGIVKT